MTGQEARDEGAYCESCEADRLWETDRIQPVWASPTHTCGEAQDDEREAQGVAVEPIAFAVYGRSNGGLKYVSEWDEDDAREAAQFYDVVPLHRAERARKHPEPEITDEILDHAISRTRYRSHRGEPAYPDDLETITAAALRVPVGEGEQG